MFLYYVKNNMGKIILTLFVLACFLFTVFLTYAAKRADKISLELARQSLGE